MTCGKYYNVCYTCPTSSSPCVLRKVLRRSEICAKAGACAANIVILAGVIQVRDLANTPLEVGGTKPGNPAQTSCDLSAQESAGEAVLHMRLLDALGAANGLTISIPKTEVVVLGRGHHDCAWKLAGQDLKPRQAFTYLGMLFVKTMISILPYKPASAELVPVLGPFSLSVPICNVQSQYSCLSGCSRPSCSLMPHTAVNSGPQLMQPLSRFGSSSLCSTPSFAAPAVSRTVALLRLSFRSFL